MEPAENLIQRGLTDFGAFAHPVITIANMSKIDRGESFLFYYEGLSERTICVLEAVELEFKAVARTYGVELTTKQQASSRTTERLAATRQIGGKSSTKQSRMGRNIDAAAERALFNG